MSNFSCRYTTPNFLCTYRFSQHGTGSNNRPVADMNALQNDDVTADPHVRTNVDRRFRPFLYTHRPSRTGSMIMIDELGPRTDKTIISHGYSLADIKLAGRANEHMIADPYRGVFFPDAVELEMYSKLQCTLLSEYHLMRPVHVDRGQKCSAPYRHPEHPQPKLAHATGNAAQNQPAKLKCCLL